MISISTYGWYTGAFQPAATGVIAISTELIPLLSNDIATILNSYNSNYVNSKPKAFLNWMVVGEDYNAATASANHVNAVQMPLCNAGDSLKQMVGPANMVIRRNGWIYIYLSNESNQDVFFDNLVINLRHGPLVEQKDYYAFGMENPVLSTKALKYKYTPNRLEYNGKELQSKEFIDGTGLEWEDYGARMYDPQIGRWMILDPMSEKMKSWSIYNYCANNPIKFIDIEGNIIGNPNDPTTKRVQELLNKTQSGQELWVRMEASPRTIFFHNINKGNKSNTNEENNLLNFISKEHAKATTLSKTAYENIKLGRSINLNSLFVFNKKTGLFDKSADFNETHIVLTNFGVAADEATISFNKAFRMGLDIDKEQVEECSSLSIISEESEHSLQDYADFINPTFNSITQEYFENESIKEWIDRKHEREAKERAGRIVTERLEQIKKNLQSTNEPKKSQEN